MTCRQSRSDWPSFSHALAACVTADQQDCTGAMYNHLISQYKLELECGPMPNVMVALPNIGGALCSMPQSLADAHY